jgi:lysozyme
MLKEAYINQLILEEGLRLKPYHCSAGKLTIGVGRNLDDNGISKQEALFLLQNDIGVAEKSCRQAFDFFDELDEQRQFVLIDMCFNMGINRLKGFKKMIQAIKKKQFNIASEEMLSSCWARQVKTRAEKLALLMKGEELPT